MIFAIYIIVTSNKTRFFTPIAG
ncbi:hypothetical protein D043_0349A, partial [Vibrio parahaemolyticus EKP-021]